MSRESLAGNVLHGRSEPCKHIYVVGRVASPKPAAKPELTLRRFENLLSTISSLAQQIECQAGELGGGVYGRTALAACAGAACGFSSTRPSVGQERKCWCERGDSSPHGFTRQILSSMLAENQ